MWICCIISAIREVFNIDAKWSALPQPLNHCHVHGSHSYIAIYRPGMQPQCLNILSVPVWMQIFFHLRFWVKRFEALACKWGHKVAITLFWCKLEATLIQYLPVISPELILIWPLSISRFLFSLFHHKRLLYKFPRIERDLSVFESSFQPTLKKCIIHCYCSQSCRSSHPRTWSQEMMTQEFERASEMNKLSIKTLNHISSLIWDTWHVWDAGEKSGDSCCLNVCLLLSQSHICSASCLRASSSTSSTCSPLLHPFTSPGCICSALGDGRMCMCVRECMCVLAPSLFTILSVKWRTQQSVILQAQLLIGPDTHSSDTELTELQSSWMKRYIRRRGEAPILLATHSSGLERWWGWW